jgi:hypothetical protein
MTQHLLVKMRQLSVAHEVLWPLGLASDWRLDLALRHFPYAAE